VPLPPPCKAWRVTRSTKNKNRHVAAEILPTASAAASASVPLPGPVEIAVELFVSSFSSRRRGFAPSRRSRCPGRLSGFKLFDLERPAPHRVQIGDPPFPPFPPPSRLFWSAFPLRERGRFQRAPALQASRTRSQRGPRPKGIGTVPVRGLVAFFNSSGERLALENRRGHLNHADRVMF